MCYVGPINWRFERIPKILLLYSHCQDFKIGNYLGIQRVYSHFIKENEIPILLNKDGFYLEMFSFIAFETNSEKEAAYYFK